MRVAKISIKNLLGIEELEFSPAGFTRIEALNGKGKTSTIEAIRSIIDGGHDATLLRNGAEKGEVVILLDDGTEIRKTVTERGSDLSYIHPEHGPLKSPKSHVDKLFDALSVNPVAFVTADPKRQLEIFLETVTLDLDPEQLREAIGGTIELTDADLVGRPLDVIDRLHKRAYDERTGVNREAKGKQATVDQLKGSLPEDDGEDPKTEIERLEAENETAPAAAREQMDALRTRAGEVIGERTAELEEKIAQLKAELQAAEEQRDGIRTDIEGKLETKLAGIREGERVRAAAATERLRALRASLQSRAAAENTRQTVDGLKAEVQELTEKSQALTNALAQLDAVKLGLLRTIPIKGVEVTDGVLTKDGVPFHRLNRAEQVKIALRLAQLRAGAVPLVCVDGIEVLDEPTFEAFAKNAPKSGLQFVVTKVWHGEGPPPEGLSIETAGELAEVGA